MTRHHSRDHRLIVLAERARSRTQRRCLLLLAACDAGEPSPELVARLDRLIGESDRLWTRLAELPVAESQRRAAWRVVA